MTRFCLAFTLSVASWGLLACSGAPDDQERPIADAGVLVSRTSMGGGASAPEADAGSGGANVVAWQAAGGACGEDAGTERPDGAAAATLTDRQILEVLLVSNTDQVNQGTIARVRAVADRVKQFAGQMVVAHTAGRDAVLALCADGLDGTPSDVSVALAANGSRVIDVLDMSSSLYFDRRYMDAEVDQHAQALAFIVRMEEAAESPAVSALLADQRAHVSAQLAAARRLLAGL